MPERNEPLFLTREMVDEIHETAISAYGDLRGILNEHLLESSINQPRHTYHIGGGDLFEVAAAYAFHIIADHPYWDGNKRTGVDQRFFFSK
jgi:death-on-curing protein